MKTNSNVHSAHTSGHRSPATGWQTMWRRTGQMLLTLWTATATMVVLADPQGGSVTFGEGNIGRIENGTTVINQLSDRMSIDWESFNVAVDERVVFQQPSSSATALNRIFDQNPSQIFGAIDANGRILLLNPNGILFGETAQVNIQSLVASSLELSLEDFKSGNYDLTALANSHGSAIINHGLIQAASGGSVSLVGDTVVNSGVIVAEYGQVNLAAGRQATVDFDGDGLLLFAVDAQVTENEQALDNAVLNTGKIIADGGQVLMAANTAQDVFSNVVNNTGKVRAMRIDNSGGVVRLIGSGGTVSHSGQIDVSSDDGTGGLVEITSERVGLFGSAHIDASGRDGGGVVHIGGGVQGGDESIENADYTYVSQDAIVRADATAKGDGGEVVIWSEIGTRVHGELSARGGVDGGDGGFIETSGKLGLVVANTPDVTAEHGDGGEWLIDPFDITIVDGNAPGVGIGNVNPFVSTATATIGAQLIADALAGGASVTVTTGGTIGDGEGNGDITLDVGATLNFDGGDGGTLTLTALNDIIIDGVIQDSGGANESLNLVFNATNDIFISATGSINLGAAGSFDGTGIDFTNEGFLLAQGGAGISLDLEASFNNTGTLNAGSAAVFVTAGGNGAGATLNIAGTIFGEGNSFEGGAGNDVFDVLNGNSGQLQGNGGVDTFNLSADVTGDVNGGEGNDIFNAISSITGNLNGEGGNDRFNISSGGGAGTVSGGAGDDVFDFAGGFNITTISGGADSDTLDFADVGAAPLLVVTLSDALYAANDFENIIGNTLGTLVSGTGDDVWFADAAGDGTVAVNGGPTLTFSDFATLDAGDGTDTQLGPNQDVTWTVTLAGDLEPELPVVLAPIASIEVVSGGTGVDTFNIDNNYTGSINGGGGNDVFNINASVTGVLNGNDDNDSFNVNAGGDATAINGNGGTDTLTVDNGNNNTWTIDAANSGDVQGQDFDDVEILIGGANDDDFVLVTAGTAVSVAGGSGGSNSLTASNNVAISVWAVTSQNTGTLNALNFAGIQTLQGGAQVDQFSLGAVVDGTVLGGNGADVFTLSGTGAATTIDGQGGTDTLVGINDMNTWTVSLNNQGTVDTQSFIRIESLTGGSAVDIFNITADLAGDVRGGDGPDVFNIGNGNGPIGLFGEGGDDLFDFAGNFNATTISGGANNDTVDFADRNGAITVTLTDALYPTPDIETFVGNSTNATLESGAGDDTWSVAASTGDGTVLLAGATLINFSEFTTLDAGTGTDTQLGPNQDVTWTVNGAGDLIPQAPIVLPPVASIEILFGGTGVDTFNIDNDFTGTIGGGGGNDIFNINASVTGNLNGNEDNDEFNLNTGGDAISINGNTGSDTLTVDNGSANTWTINTANSGTVGAQSFISVENLIGNELADIFNVNAVVGGNIVGGDGANQFNISAAVTGSLTGGMNDDLFTLNGTGIAASIDGGDGNDTLTRNNAVGINQWNVTSQNAGTLNTTIINTMTGFSNIENLQGGSLIDQFVLGAVLDGAVRGGASNDVFTFSGTGAASVIDGEGGGDRLEGSDSVNTWAITSANAGTLNVTQPFIRVEHLTGGDSVDTFNFTATTAGNTIGGGDADIFNIGDGAGPVTLSGGDGNDLFDFAGAFITTSISGGADSDTVDFADRAGAITVTLTDALYAPLDIEIFVGNSNATLASGAGDDQWFVDAVSGDGTVLVDGTTLVNFSAFTTLDAGLGQDSQLGPNQNVTWTVDAGGNLVPQAPIVLPTIVSIEELTGGTGIDIFNIDNNYAGSISGGGGDDIFNINAAVTGDLSGNAGNDSFILNVGGAANLIDGNGDVDTLTGDSTIMNTWDINMLNSGTVNAQQFSNIENLIGGTLVDIFNVNAALGGNITGGDGDNQYNISAAVAGAISGGADIDAVTLIGAGSANSIDGGGGVLDTLEGSSTLDNTWTMQSLTSGSLNGSTTYSNIEEIIGGALIDTLTASNTVNDWLVDTANAGTLNSLVFSEIENLSGGSGMDNFTVSAQLDGSIDGNGGIDDVDILATAVVGGDVNGGDNNDDMQILGTVAGNVSGGGGDDALDIDNTVTGNVLGDGGNDAIVVRSNGVAAVIDGGDGTDSLTIDNLLSNTWEIQSPNAGTVAGQAFLGIENLIGNAGNDLFVMQMTGTVESIDGVGGINTLTGSDDQLNTWSVLTINAGELNGATFSNIQNLNGGALVDEFTLAAMLDGDLAAGGGNDSITLAGGSAASIDGGADSDTLAGADIPNAWVVNVPNAGTVNTTQAFSDIENLSGGSAVDMFDIDAPIDGDLSGNGGNDIFNLNAAAAVGGDVRGGDDDDELNVDGTVAGSVSGGLGNDAINIRAAVTGSVLGDAGIDTILISATGSTPLIDGGDDTDTLTYDANPGDTTDWVINAENAGMVNLQMFTNIENLAGDDAEIDSFLFTTAGSIGSIDGGTGAGIEDVLTGRNDFNVWNVTDLNAGQLNGDAFSGIEHLNGGSNTDIFTLSAIIDGDITGGAGDDNFAFQGAGAAASIDGGDGTDSIFGDDTENNWAVTMPNSGTLNTQAFVNIENLNGGTAVDIFDISAALDGDINGGGDADVFTLAAAVGGNVSGEDGDDSFVLAGPGMAANIDGGNDTDSLTGSDAVNAWTISAPNGGTVGLQSFENIENLSGGSLADTFNVNAQLDGAISGGGDADTFNLGAAVIGNVSGDDGGDSFVLQAGGSANNLDGGNDIDTLTANDEVNVWTVATANSGTLNMQMFANIENLSGGSMMDTFNVNAQLDGDIIGGDGMNVFALAAAVIGDVTGGAGDDSFTLAGAGSANSLDGGAGNNMLTGDDIINMWLVSDTNTGMLNTQAFTNVQNLNGGDAVDTFDVNAQLDGNISGNGDADVVTTGATSSVGGTISGDAGDDMITIGGTVAGSVSGGDNTDTIVVDGAVAGNVAGDGGDDMMTVSAAIGGNVSGDAGNDAITVNANGTASLLAGGTGNDTLTYDLMVDNAWAIDAVDGGTVNMQAFEQMENLVGGAQVDMFSIEASVTGNIDGGMGNDVFTLSDQAAVTVGGLISGNGGNDELLTAFLGGNRMIAYDGGAGMDDFTVTGNTVADYTGVFDASTGGLVYTSGAAVQQALLSNLETISDQVMASSLQINAATDVTLSAGTTPGANPFSAMIGTLDFGFANKPGLDLNVSTNGATVSLVGDMMFPGTLDIDLSDGGTLMSDQNMITANSLIIRNAQIVSNLVTTVRSMMLDMVSGMFSVDETDQLDLLSSDVTGSLTVNAGGALTVAAGDSVSSSDSLTLNAPAIVSIDGNVSADNLAITANNMQLNGNVTGSTSANLNAGAITQGATGQLNSGSLTTTTTAGMSLLGNNAISTLNATNMGGDLVVNNASTSTMSITNSGGLVDINNAGNLTISGLTNNLATSVDSTNLIIAGNITTTGAAATTLTGSGAVMQNAVVSAVGNMFINGNTINVASTTNAQSSGGNVAYNGMGDVTVNDITAQNGSVLIASQMGDIFAAKTESAITSDNVTFLGNGRVGLGVTPFAVFSVDGMLMLESPTNTNPNIDLFINEFGKFTTTGVRAINQRDLRAFATTSIFGQSLSSALSTGTDIDSNVFNIEQPDIVVPIGHGVTIPCGQIEDEEEACK